MLARNNEAKRCPIEVHQNSVSAASFKRGVSPELELSREAQMALNRMEGGAESFNKERWAFIHERARQECQRMDSSGRQTRSFHLAEPSPIATTSAPLSRLHPVNLSELVLGERLNGRVLFGKLCVEPFKMASVLTVLEDSTGSAMRMVIYNVLPSNAANEEALALFPSGTKVAVKEPYFKLCRDGMVCVRVDNPEDICHTSVILQRLQTMQSEGNAFFLDEKWVEAIEKYSTCIDEGSAITGSDPELDEVLMLVFSNRAEACLRLQRFDEALSDANTALDFNPRRLKSVNQKARALHGLAHYKKACEVFTVALDLSGSTPGSTYAVENLRRSKISYFQSMHGVFELSDYYSTGGACKAPSCTDFLGPVEIRRSQHGSGRRGLFATENVEAGEILLVSNPFAIARLKLSSGQPSLAEEADPEDERILYQMNVQHELIGKLVHRVTVSKLRMAQLYTLAVDDNKETGIPSMELFTPGSEWVPPDFDKLQLDIDLVSNIANAHHFANGAYPSSLLAARGTQYASSGLWLLPSFLNHSCVPNTTVIFIGDALFVRCARHVEEGEELTMAYSPTHLHETLEAREAQFRTWRFTCKCQRCFLEQRLKPKLAEISKIICDELRAQTRIDLSLGMPKELSLALVRTEALFREIDLEPRKQGWIRAGFFDAYIWKYSLDALNDSASQDKALRFVNDIVNTVCPSIRTVQLAATFLVALRNKRSKTCPVYLRAEEKVMGIYGIVFGRQPDAVLRDLVKFHQPGQFNPTKFWAP